MQKHVAKVEELENKIRFISTTFTTLIITDICIVLCLIFSIFTYRSLLVEKATNEMVIDRLRQDLAANKSHIQAMSRKLDRVYSEVESKCKTWQTPDVQVALSLCLCCCIHILAS